MHRLAVFCSVKVGPGVDLMYSPNGPLEGCPNLEGVVVPASLGCHPRVLVDGESASTPKVTTIDCAPAKATPEYTLLARFPVFAHSSRVGRK